MSMELPSKILAHTAAEWQQAWSYAPRISRMVRQLTAVHGDCLTQAAYFAAGKLYDEDFHLFINGGQPLLKRQRGGWMEEILFHPAPGSVAGCYCPVAVELMVSFEPIREIRSKISRCYCMVPAFVAKVNLGELGPDAAKVLWNVARDESTVAIGNLLHEKGLKWLDSLSDPASLEERVIHRQMPFVDDATGLELVLALRGRLAAQRVVEAWWTDEECGAILDRTMMRLCRQFGPVYRGEDENMNIVVLCMSYDLWTRPRLPWRF